MQKTKVQIKGEKVYMFDPLFDVELPSRKPRFAFSSLKKAEK